MEKKLSKLIGAGLFLSSAALVVKYVKDYSNVKHLDEEDTKEFREDAAKAGESARRTYIALKQRKDPSKDAGEFLSRTVKTAEDAGALAAKAGMNYTEAVKGLAKEYREDPENFRTEFSENIREMGENIKLQFIDVCEKIVTGPSGAAKETETEDDDITVKDLNQEAVKQTEAAEDEEENDAKEINKAEEKAAAKEAAKAEEAEEAAEEETAAKEAAEGSGTEGSESGESETEESEIGESETGEAEAAEEDADIRIAVPRHEKAEEPDGSRA